MDTAPPASAPRLCVLTVVQFGARLMGMDFIPQFGDLPAQFANGVNIGSVLVRKTVVVRHAVIGNDLLEGDQTAARILPQMFETVTIHLRRWFGAGIMAAGWVRSLDWTHIVSGVPAARFLQTPRRMYWLSRYVWAQQKRPNVRSSFRPSEAEMAAGSSVGVEIARLGPSPSAPCEGDLFRKPHPGHGLESLKNQRGRSSAAGVRKSSVFGPVSPFSHSGVTRCRFRKLCPSRGQTYNLTYQCAPQ